MSSPLITVIVPTYRDKQGTEQCIALLAQQTLPIDEYEVIIVDNNETPYEYNNMPDNFILLHEPLPGSYAARNAGMKIAKGKYIAFTDSDCLVSRDWLEKGLTYLKDNARVAGNIILKNTSGDKLNPLASAYEKGFAFNQKDNVSRGESVTANLMIQKEILSLIGDFDHKLYSGGDIEWNRRASKLAIDIIYAEDVIVTHPIRGSMQEVINKRIRVIGGQYHKMNFLMALKFLVPPFKDIPYLKNKEDMTGSEKITSWCVRYYLKLVAFVYIILLKAKFVKPRRS